jgi:hypothetical protein
MRPRTRPYALLSENEASSLTEVNPADTAVIEIESSELYEVSAHHKIMGDLFC